MFSYCINFLSTPPPPFSQQYIPFAVIGSDREVTVGGKKVLGRQTKWGFIEVENKRHCEFAQLRDMLIRCVCVCVFVVWMASSACAFVF